MEIDIDKYQASEQYVKTTFINTCTGDLQFAISVLSAACHCPCIVVAIWVGECTNWCQESQIIIKKLKDFYGYTKILNKPDGCPILE
jgi:hypothetical protein